MSNTQRTKNDIATIDRRDSIDKATKESRSRNDEMTSDRRDKADKILEDNRSRNDEMTSDRRVLHDRNPNLGLGVLLLVVLIGLAIVAFFVFT